MILEKGVFDIKKTYVGYDKVISCSNLNSQNLSEIKQYENSNQKVLVEIPNTFGLSSQMASLIPNNVFIRIIGGHTDEYLKGMKNPNISLVREKNTYTKEELINILSIIEKIEDKIDKTWNDYEKTLFLYQYLKKEITYRKPSEVEGLDGIGMANRGRKWDSLIGLLDKMSTCNGYGIMYKELLDRQNIKCTHISGYYKSDISSPKEGQHAWSVVTIDNNSFLVDIIWDSIAYENGIDQITGFGVSDIENYIFKNNRELVKELNTNFNEECNDINIRK